MSDMKDRVVSGANALRYLGCTKKYGGRLIEEVGLKDCAEVLLSELIGLRLIRKFERGFGVPASAVVRSRAVEMVRAYLAKNELHEDMRLKYYELSNDPTTLEIGTLDEIGRGGTLGLVSGSFNYFR